MDNSEEASPDPTTPARDDTRIVQHPTPSSAPSRRLGPYLILNELGRGGQGTVYLAEDTRLRRRVALKVLELQSAFGGQGPLERLRHEAEAAARLDDPGLCAVFEMGVEDQVAWMAMRYVEGETLAKRIHSTLGAASFSFVRLADTTDTTLDSGAVAPSVEGRDESTLTRGFVEWVALLELFERAARSLHVAHEAGILHRDIKPANIMVTAGLKPVILDFGLARTLDLDWTNITQTGQLLGTPAYMSPEQLLAQRLTLDPRTDVYSLGVSLYECATLKRPFEGPTREALYQQIATKEPIDPRRLNPDIPRDLATIILTAISKDRDRRYLTAAAFADDLAALREGRPVAARPVGPLGRLLRWGRREPAWASLVVVLMVALPVIAALGTSYLKDRPRVLAQQRAEVRRKLDGHLVDGFLSLGERQFVRAIDSFERALALDDGSPEAVAGMALAELARERPEAALAILDEHAAADRPSTTILRARARGREDRRVGAIDSSEARDEIDHYI
ncbi:MAG: protein kinase, partial [Planctomycetes bacterium]|nr:protein kinase [Planctomycetota bacterium]